MTTPAARGARLLAGLFACALLPLACGGEEPLSKAEYERLVREAYAPVQLAFEATRGTPGSELAGRLEDARDRLRLAAERLEEREPPEEVEEENEELVEGMRAFAADVDRLLASLRDGDAEAVADFNAEIGENEAVGQIAEAAEEMKFRGYDLGRIAEE